MKSIIMNETIKAVATLLGMIAIVMVLLGYPVMLLWNWLMPTIFNLPTLTFWEAFGLNVMSGILFRTNVNIKKN